MSSVAYGNGSLSSNEEPANSSIPLAAPGAVVSHPYLATNPNVAYAAVAAAVSSVSPSASLGQYQHYYGHALPQQQFLHVPQTAGPFYSGTGMNHLPHQGDFSNSSSSIASSSSSLESSRKASNRKRATDKPVAASKAAGKRKAVGFADFLSTSRNVRSSSPTMMMTISMTMMMTTMKKTNVISAVDRWAAWWWTITIRRLEDPEKKIKRNKRAKIIVKSNVVVEWRWPRTSLNCATWFHRARISLVNLIN